MPSDLNLSALDCYVHNVSPVKISDKKKQWFECTLQTTQGNIRAVCFEPTQSDVARFKEAAESKSPVKVTNTRLGNKRPGYPQDIIIPKKAMVEKLTPSADFQHQKVASQMIATTIGNLQNLKQGQLITLKGYVNCMTPIKQVTQRATQSQVYVKECQLTDTTGSMKLVLWGKFTTQVQDDQTYEFKNLRIKSDDSKVYLSTT